MPPIHSLLPRLRRPKSLTLLSNPQPSSPGEPPRLPFPPTDPEPEEPFFLTVHPLPQLHTHSPSWIITYDLPSIAEGEIRIGSGVVMWYSADLTTRHVAEGAVTGLVAVRNQWTILKVTEYEARTTCLLCVPTYWVDTRSAPWWQPILAHWKSAWKIPYTEADLNVLLRSHLSNQPSTAIRRGPSLSLPDIRTIDIEERGIEEY